jgi:hypothetical protein
VPVAPDAGPAGIFGVDMTSVEGLSEMIAVAVKGGSVIDVAVTVTICGDAIESGAV